MREDKECCICGQVFEKEDLCECLVCGRPFCSECMNDSTTVCPDCRDQ